LFQVTGFEIGQVLINLALNAMDAVAEESGKTGVRSRCLSIGSGTKLSSRFAIAVMALLLSNFRSYFVLSSHRESGGLGLGLSIVRNIVEAHGGRVWAEKGLKEGAAFIVELPVDSHVEILSTEAT
jgi:Osmosensitive K+ channel histidine kinase